MIKKRGIAIAAVVAVLALSSVFAVWAASAESTSQTKAFNSVDLPDGEYEPDVFTWSGGSGRLEYIKCDRIEVTKGGAYAELAFASPHYDHLKVAGRTYRRTEVIDGTSRFQVPVKLNTNMELEGRTTAMSQPHWIPYTIYVGKKGAEAHGEAMIDTETLETQNKVMKQKLMNETPVVVGLAGGARVGLEAAQHLRIFRYDGGSALIQVERSGAGSQTLYGQKVVNYLVVPMDMEIPAGAEKDYIIIRQAPQKVFVDSTRAMALLTETPLKREVSDGAPVSRGEFRELVASSGTKLCVLSEDKATAKIAGKLTTLQIPLFIDCAETEITPKAKREWALAYGEIFGAREAAENVIEAGEMRALREKKQQQGAAIILLLGIIAAMVIVPAAAKRG